MDLFKLDATDWDTADGTPFTSANLIISISNTPDIQNISVYRREDPSDSWNSIPRCAGSAVECFTVSSGRVMIQNIPDFSQFAVLRPRSPQVVPPTASATPPPDRYSTTHSRRRWRRDHNPPSSRWFHSPSHGHASADDGCDPRAHRAGRAGDGHSSAYVGSVHCCPPDTGASHSGSTHRCAAGANPYGGDRNPNRCSCLHGHTGCGSGDTQHAGSGRYDRSTTGGGTRRRVPTVADRGDRRGGAGRGRPGLRRLANAAAAVVVTLCRNLEALFHVCA